MNLTPKTMADLCRTFGGQLTLPIGCVLDPVQLLWALSGNETSFGANIVPHHEAAYCPFTRPQAGIYYRQNQDVRNQTQQIGCMAHMSYGPLQLMYYNAVKFHKSVNALSVNGLLNDPNVGMLISVEFLNSEIFGRQKCATLDEVGDAYNSGNARDSIVPVEYIQKLKLNYAMVMPQ